MVLRYIFCGLMILSTTSAMAVPLAGIASQEITPTQDEQIPLGGYGSSVRRNWPFKFFKYPFVRFFRAAEGSLDPIRVKALYLKQERPLLFISLDVVGVTSEVHQELTARLVKKGFKPEEIMISGTHTHAGPGALSRNFFWQVVAMDRFQKKYYNRFIHQIMETAEAAILNAAPASLHSLSFATSGLQRNRRGSDRPLNPQANLLLVKNATGQWLGGFVNYAIHGTSLGDENLHFSSDAPGSIERGLEELLSKKNGFISQIDPTFLFINGAEGDVSPAHGGTEGIARIGDEFSRTAELHWNDAKSLTGPWQARREQVELGKPQLYLKKCIEEKWIPEKLKFSATAFFGRKTYLYQIELGPLVLLSWPGEATTELGQRLEAIARKRYKDAWVMGLTNDHLAYFTTAEEFKRGGYETCVNLYGPQGGEKIISAHEQLLKRN